MSDGSMPGSGDRAPGEAGPGRLHDVIRPGSILDSASDSMSDSMSGGDSQTGIVTAKAWNDPALSPAQWINLLALTARAYEPLWRHRSIAWLTAGKLDTAEELRTLVAWLDPQPGDTILDAGCSAGLYARTLARAQDRARLYAVDISQAFLHEARRRAEREGVALALLQANVEHMPFRDHAFDAIVSGGSLNEFRHPERALAEFSRTLVAGGRLFLMYTARSTTPAGRALQRTMELSGLAFPRPEEVDDWANERGLEVVRQSLHPPIVLAMYRKMGATQRSGAAR